MEVSLCKDISNIEQCIKRSSSNVKAYKRNDKVIAHIHISLDGFVAAALNLNPLLLPGLKHFVDSYF